MQMAENVDILLALLGNFKLSTTIETELMLVSFNRYAEIPISLALRTYISTITYL